MRMARSDGANGYVTLPVLCSRYPWGMTTGGISKQRTCFWAAVAFFVAAILFAIEAMTGGADEYRAGALIAFMFGAISLAGYGAQILVKRSVASRTD